jgi:RNA polymerase sigma factor (sigma-70 family)
LPNDHETMLAVREGDLDQQSLLFERHHRHLYNFFLRMTGSTNDSEDLVQEVFFRMLNYRHTYRDDSRFETWMFQIARSALSDSSRKTRRTEPLPEGRILVNPDPSPEDSLMKKSETDFLLRALGMLSEEKREVLLLGRFENLGFREIARILREKETTVKVRAHRAVKERGKLAKQRWKVSDHD